MAGDPVNFVDPYGLKLSTVHAHAMRYGAVGLSILDVADTASTIFDPCTSGGEKLAAAGLLLIGASKVKWFGKFSKASKTRVRHYTSRSGSKGIESDGVIKASDHNRVYLEPANKKPLTKAKAEDKYQLKQGRGRDYVETDVDNSQLEWVKNPRYGNPELTVKGDLPLDNPSFRRR